MLKNIPETFTRQKLSRITQADVQAVINEYKGTHSPKSTINLHGFISGVLKHFRPSMSIHTTLPQKVPNDGYIPSEEDIKRILDASSGTRYHIPFQLGIMSLRLSEICALTLDDIDTENNLLRIDKALVKGADNRYILKLTKTEAGTRSLYIPDKLIKEIMDNKAIYDGYPNQCLKALNRYQDRLGIPRFRFHDLRHFFASYSHSQGVSDADILASGGWRSEYTMKKVYRHEMKQRQAQENVFNKLLS